MTTTQTTTQDTPDDLREAFLALAETVESFESEIAQRQGFIDRQATGPIMQNSQMKRFRRLLRGNQQEAMRTYYQFITVGSEHASEPYIVSFVKKHLPSLREQTQQECASLLQQLEQNIVLAQMYDSIANTNFIKG